MIFADRRGIRVSAMWMLTAPQSYGTALAAILIATFLRHSVGAELGFTHPFIVYCPIIVALALWTKLAVALFATAFSAFSAEFFFLESAHSFGGGNPWDIVGLLTFLAVGMAISGIGDQFRRRTHRLQEFEKAIEGVQEMILVLDRDYRYLIANRTFLKYTGRKPEDVLGRTVSHVMGADFFQRVLKPKLDECFKGTPVQFEFHNNYANRGERDILVSYFPIAGAGGVDRITVILQDVTEQRRMEAALRRREQEYRQFVARSSEGIFREELSEPVSIDLPEEELIEKIRRSSYVTECNDVMARMYGYESGEAFVGKRLGDMLVPEDPENLALIRAFIRGGFQVLEKLSNEVDSQGNRKVFRNSMTGIVEDGKLVRTWGIQSDVTDQVRAEESRIGAEQALRASEVHFRELVEQASDGIFIADAQGRYSDVNSAGAEMLGYTREEVMVLSIADVVVSQDVVRIEQETRRLAEGGTIRSEWMFRRKDGSQFPGEVAARQLSDGRLQAILRDVTDRKMAEEEMRRSEERFRVALKDSPITVFNQDRELRFTWVYNSHFVSAEEMIGKTDADIFGTKKAARLTHLKQSVLHNAVPVREEFTLAFEGKNHTFDLTLEPLFDAEGGVVGITGAAVDIAQLRDMADRLIEAKETLTREKSFLQGEIQKELGFEEIVGQSSSLREALKKASIVAPTDSTVLLLGETGTGKELVARSLHALSRRREKNFVKLNCAAVPAGLLESELFGHERGAFTGAVSQKVGRIELAHKGTLFLDEIGELPLELQPKLLRVLQDREFERLGGVQTLHVDVRIIAATNRNLQQEAAEKKFREDLFYRLNVFPVYLPALRERPGDIPVLVEHFVEKHGAKMGRHIDIIPTETMDILENWSWPGNIRELENMIERMVIMTKGRVLAAPPAELKEERPPDNSLTEMEREHIIRVLRETNGVLSGASGAANRLGLKRTTLQSMLKRFNIQAHEFRRGSSGAYGA
jgi:formate hydrogenlyase transcriptional activator